MALGEIVNSRPAIIRKPGLHTAPVFGVQHRGRMQVRRAANCETSLSRGSEQKPK